MTRRWMLITVFAVTLLGLAATLTQAASSTTAPAEKTTVMGKLTKVDGSTVYVKNSDGKEESFRTDSSTVVYDDGQKASLSSLSVGQKIKATMSNGVATKIQSGGKPHN